MHVLQTVTTREMHLIHNKLYLVGVIIYIRYFDLF
jgi:hypothetical protein